MNDKRARLSRCFSAVFPALTGEELASASVQSVELWDSVASVTLVALIEEEFGIEVELEAIDRLVSFRAILDYLNKEGADVNRKS